MSNYVWEKIDGFQSPREFSRFLKWIEKQLAEGSCEEILLEDSGQEYWQERHFKSRESGEVWKLVRPDPGYYAGAWYPVSL